MRRPPRPVALLLAAAAALAGCRAKGDYDNENDALRRRVASLEADNARLSAERNEAVAKLTEMARARADTDAGEALQALPRVAGIEIDRYSGFNRPLGDASAQRPRPEEITVYIRTYDGRQRFVQVAGSLTVEAALLAPVAPRRKGEAPAPAGPATKMALSATLSPSEVREAYRSSPLGTHYRVSLPLPTDAPRDLSGSLVLRAEFIDPVGGQTLHAERIIPE